MARGRSLRFHSSRSQEFVLDGDDPDDRDDSFPLAARPSPDPMAPLCTAGERLSLEGFCAQHGLSADDVRALVPPPGRPVRSDLTLDACRALRTAMDDAHWDDARGLVGLVRGVRLDFADDAAAQRHWQDLGFALRAQSYADDAAAMFRFDPRQSPPSWGGEPGPRGLFPDDPSEHGVMSLAANPAECARLADRLRLVANRRRQLPAQPAAGLALHVWDMHSDYYRRDAAQVTTLAGLRQALTLCAAEPRESFPQWSQLEGNGRRVEIPVPAEVFTQWVRFCRDLPGWRGVFLGYTMDYTGTRRAPMPRRRPDGGPGPRGADGLAVYPQGYGRVLRARAVVDLNVAGTPLRAHVMSVVKDNTDTKAESRLQSLWKAAFPDCGPAEIAQHLVDGKPYTSEQWMAHADRELFPPLTEAPAASPLDGFGVPCDHARARWRTHLEHGVAWRDCPDCQARAIEVVSLCQDPDLRSHIPEGVRQRELACESIRALDAGLAPPANWHVLCAQLPVVHTGAAPELGGRPEPAPVAPAIAPRGGLADELFGEPT